MTAAELRNELEGIPDGAEVVLWSDRDERPDCARGIMRTQTPKLRGHLDTDTADWSGSMKPEDTTGICLIN